MITQQRLDEIKARCEAATPGPWKHRDPPEVQIPDPNWERHEIVDESLKLVAQTHYPTTEWKCARNEEMERNGPFIAAARTDIPDLLAEVERLRAEAAEMQLRIQEQDAELDELIDEVLGG
jgi:hypothetical protein